MEMGILRSRNTRPRFPSGDTESQKTPCQKPQDSDLKFVYSKAACVQYLSDPQRGKAWAGLSSPPTF